MTAAWIIGGNGLLGSALWRELSSGDINLFTPDERFRWDSESELIDQLEVAVRKFAIFAAAEKKWQIYWAAGVGTMNSNLSELTLETRTLMKLLDFVESEPGLIGAKGQFALASSAGAIYAGTTDEVISEDTLVAPTTAYAHEKLKQENIVSNFALNYCNVTALLARMSTLYGPGNATAKQQGLIAKIARCIMRNQPIQIYVPFDTIRDYITADDAGAMIVAALRVLSEKPGVFTKIIASEKPTTIAEIISIYKRITRRTPRIVVSASKLSSIYTRRIQFHSNTLPVNGMTSKTSLLVGIARVVVAERAAFTRSHS